MLIYRINQVPALNYIKFLQLIGIELAPAQPARAEVTFTVSRPDLTSAIVPKGTQVAAAGGSGQSVLFELDQALIVIGASLAAVQTFDGTGYTTQTNKNNTPGQSFYPFTQTPKAGNALLLGFSSPVAFPHGSDRSGRHSLSKRFKPARVSEWRGASSTGHGGVGVLERGAMEHNQHR